MAEKRPKSQGRAGFLNATKSAAICERIKKEERSLHKLLQTQIELGRIVLPPEATAPHPTEAAAAEAGDDEAEVGRHVAWLVAAHRVKAPVGQPAEGEQEDEEGAEEGEEGSERAAAKAAQLRVQMRSISQSLWGSVAAGAALGSPYVTRSQSDYQFNYEAVQAMRSTGELDSSHHRRRDAHGAYVEACARQKLLQRGAVPGSKAQ